MGLRDKIATADDTRRQQVPCPEWGVTLEVRSITNRQKADWEVRCATVRKGKTKVDPHRLKADLIVTTCYDPFDGSRVFTYDDIPMLAERNAAVLERLFDVACDLTGITQRDEGDILGKSDEATP